MISLTRDEWRRPYLIGKLSALLLGLIVLGGASGCAPGERTAMFVQTGTPAPTSAPSITSTPLPGVGSSQTSPKDGMLMMYIPEGEFIMGSDDLVFLDAFWIDSTEVTNAMVAGCVSDGKCSPPASTLSSTRSSYYDDSEYADYPVIYVNWNQAQTYCEWRGGSLPTEAQWEKAAYWDEARQEKREYPWGSSADCTVANYWGREYGCVGDTVKVGSYPAGMSYYGLFDVAGNVWEWMMDWDDPSLYANPPSSNPTGASSGENRVLRGGSWFDRNDLLRSSYRSGDMPEYALNYIGFRCVQPVTSP